MSTSRVPPSLSHLLPPDHNLTPLQIRLLEKQQEYAGLQALREASGQMLERVEELGRMGNVMADGGAAIGSVLRNWHHVFSILNLFDKPTPQDPSSNPEESDKPLPQLVRLQYGGGGSEGQEKAEGDGKGEEKRD